VGGLAQLRSKNLRRGLAVVNNVLEALGEIPPLKKTDRLNRRAVA